jgi:putative acetyltransferase
MRRSWTAGQAVVVRDRDEVTLRPERPGDEPAIAAVVEAAFGSAAEARLVELLRASEGFWPELSIVAEAGGEIVGHVMISEATLVDGPRTRPVANLSPLAVRPDHQGRGTGSALVRASTARADERGEPVVVLEGAPAYYGRFGFEPATSHGIHIDLPDWAPPEAAQVLRLRAYDPAVRGRVRYPAAFTEIEARDHE